MSFQGSIQELPVPDIIQLVSVSGKTGMFMLVRGTERGYIYLRNGRIVHAELGGLSGEEAVYALAIWSTGDFQFTPGKETDSVTIEKTNTSLLMEAARRLDEWKVLGPQDPGRGRGAGLEAARARRGGDALAAGVERRHAHRRPPDRRGGRASDGIELLRHGQGALRAGHRGPRRDARPAGRGASTGGPQGAAPAPTSSSASASRPAAASGSAPASAAAAAMLGDEKKILMILCTRVKQEAETALGEGNLPGIDRPYKQALAEIDKGRGVEAVRDLIRHTEKAISSIRGPAIMRAFQEKMSLVMQPRI